MPLKAKTIYNFAFNLCLEWTNQHLIVSVDIFIKNLLGVVIKGVANKTLHLYFCTCNISAFANGMIKSFVSIPHNIPISMGTGVDITGLCKVYK